MFSGEILAMICACTAEPTINDEMFQLTGAISFLNYLSIGQISVGYGIFGDIKWYFYDIKILQNSTYQMRTHLSKYLHSAFIFSIFQ